MTLARLGPASAMSWKNTTSPAAVQTTPSTAMAHRADAGIACGGLTKTAGRSGAVDSGRLAAPRPSGARSAKRRVTMVGGGGDRTGEGRVGEEGRYRWGPDHLKKKKEVKI